jgi:hypothetical protein
MKEEEEEKKINQFTVTYLCNSGVLLLLCSNFFSFITRSLPPLTFFLFNSFSAL